MVALLLIARLALERGSWLAYLLDLPPAWPTRKCTLTLPWNTPLYPLIREPLTPFVALDGSQDFRGPAPLLLGRRQKHDQWTRIFVY